jgi:cysteine synthase A
MDAIRFTAAKSTWLTIRARHVGGSTGTNLVACSALVEEMAERGETGSSVTLLCDGGERYGCTYYDDAWLAKRDVDWRASAGRMAAFLGSKANF